MPAVQTTYAERITALTLGQIADQEPHTIISRTVADAAGIGFGKVVCQGATDNAVIAPAGGAAAFRGVTVRDQARDPNNPDLFAQYEEAAVMTKGVVVVTTSVAVSAGDAAYYVDATGVITNVSTANVAMNAIFDADAGIGALVPLRLK